VIAYFLFFAALVLVLAILTLLATMLSASISHAEDRYESMPVNASSAGIAEIQSRSAMNQVGALASTIGEARDPESSRSRSKQTQSQ
jgi:hypothetical protein